MSSEDGFHSDIPVEVDYCLTNTSSNGTSTFNGVEFKAGGFDVSVTGSRFGEYEDGTAGGGGSVPSGETVCFTAKITYDILSGLQGSGIPWGDPTIDPPNDLNFTVGVFDAQTPNPDPFGTEFAVPQCTTDSSPADYVDFDQTDSSALPVPNAVTVFDPSVTPALGEQTPFGFYERQYFPADLDFSGYTIGFQQRSSDTNASTHVNNINAAGYDGDIGMGVQNTFPPGTTIQDVLFWLNDVGSVSFRDITGTGAGTSPEPRTWFFDYADYTFKRRINSSTGGGQSDAPGGLILSQNNGPNPPTLAAPLDFNLADLGGAGIDLDPFINSDRVWMATSLTPTGSTPPLGVQVGELLSSH